MGLRASSTLGKGDDAGTLNFDAGVISSWEYGGGVLVEGANGGNGGNMIPLGGLRKGLVAREVVSPNELITLRSL